MALFVSKDGKDLEEVRVVCEQRCKFGVKLRASGGVIMHVSACFKDVYWWK